MSPEECICMLVMLQVSNQIKTQEFLEEFLSEKTKMNEIAPTNFPALKTFSSLIIFLSDEKLMIS